jgi:nicotinate-nucleotide adenylyltransferase
MRIGLFGGSFNPVHRAHLRIAAEARSACMLDRVIFIPAADPPHKMLAGDVSFEQRSEMVRIALADIPGFEISTVEAERGGKSYSIDTIRTFRELFPDDDLFFIIGGDSFLDLGTWHRVADIFPLCSLIVVERPGCAVPRPIDALPGDLRGLFSQDASGGLIHRSGTVVTFITGSPLELSSTEIRRIAAAGGTITRYVPLDVAAYISQQRIYRSCQ